jgi:RHS repeat-associated protein
LRAIDLNPEANTVHPIAIYTYDAGGERIIKQNATSVAIYENALQVGTTIKNDFMLYPSGMLVARPAADGTGALSYTKHYFAGTQRVSSKIGTTTNLGKFLQEWTLIENSSGGAPINLVSTSHDQLTVAETGITNVYTAFEITPTPTFSSNTAFLPIASFTATGTETETFWFHPDHLGSSNYITNYIGDVSQHMEYFAFGETFIEEHKNSHNSPYKFNGKELDEESGLYYYGARYFDPRISIWLSVDGEYDRYPHYSPYNYCLQNPIVLLDPDGNSPISIFIKQVAKQGLKRAAKESIEALVKNRLKAYMSKSWAKQLAGDALDAIDLATSQSWWEYAIEFIPVAGDAYGAAKLGEQGYNIYKVTQKFESVIKLTEKIATNSFKLLGKNKLIGKGADIVNSFITKINNQASHLGESDLAGAVKEIYGLSSGKKADGTPFQHLKEVQESLNGMSNQISSLKKQIKGGGLEGDSLKAAKGVLNDVEKQYNNITNVLNSARKEAKKF